MKWRWTAVALILVAGLFAVRTRGSHPPVSPGETPTRTHPVLETLPQPLPIVIAKSESGVCAGETHVSFNETWLADADHLSRKGWTVETLSFYVTLDSRWQRCRLCLAKAMDFLRNAADLRDPACEFLLASLPEEQFFEIGQDASERNLWLPRMQTPQSAGEAATLARLAMEAADRLTACEAFGIIESAPLVPVAEIVESVLSGWAGAKDPYIRSRFGELLYDSFLDEGSPEIHEKIAESLLQKWDQENADGTRVGMHRIAGWMLNRSLPEALERQIRDKLIREFCAGYGPQLTPTVQSAADTLSNSRRGLDRLAANLTWFEEAVRNPTPESNPGLAFNVFAPLNLSKDDSEEARCYADLVTQALIRTFPEKDDERRIQWIWAMVNAGSPLGRSYLAGTKSKDPRVATYLEWAIGRDEWRQGR